MRGIPHSHTRIEAYILLSPIIYFSMTSAIENGAVIGELTPDRLRHVAVQTGE